VDWLNRGSVLKISIGLNISKEQEMNIKRGMLGILGATAFAAFVAGCSQTAAPAPNIVE